jgi:hypothetical protein
VAQYNVDHACGHSQTHPIVGPHRERDRRLDRLSGRPCSDCYHAAQEAARAAANAAAAEANTAAGLPSLVGTEKQVAWAESIRRPICEALAKAERDFPVDPELSAPAREELHGAVALLVDEVREHAEAKWWIEVGQGVAADIGAAPKVYLIERIRDRGLAPTALAEGAEIARRREEHRGRRRAELLVMAESLADRFDASGLSSEGCATIGTIDGHAVRLENRHGLSIDGEPVGDGTRLGNLILDWSRAQASARRRAELDARSAALVGAKVA